MSNHEIVNVYQKALDKLPLENVLVKKSIYSDEDINFNATNRETLYAIQKCFTEYNKGNLNSSYRECMLGKALHISKCNIPKIPPFKNIIYYYIKYYKDRIKFIEDSFDNKGINYEDLKIEKVNIYCNKKLNFNKSNKYFDILYSKMLPNVALVNILTFLIFDNYKYQQLRIKYNKLRIKNNKQEN